MTTVTVVGALSVVGTSYVISNDEPTSAAPEMELVQASSGVGCWGDYCSGMDPQETGCAADAQTVAYRQLDHGRLDLRWSPTCKTNWARWQQYPWGRWPALREVPLALVAEQDTGYTQSINWSESEGSEPIRVDTYWTPMIYSPVRLVRAKLLYRCGGPTLVETAFDCATEGNGEATEYK